jgi:hypothetical protein
MSGRIDLASASEPRNAFGTTLLAVSTAARAAISRSTTVHHL